MTTPAGDPRDYVYDIESYPNIFTLCAKHHASGARYLFEISTRRDDRAPLATFLTYLAQNKLRMVGYNNDNFDYPVIDFIMTYPDMGPAEIYRHVQALIDAEGYTSIRNPLIEQIDLMKIHDLDRPTKFTTLKVIEINRRSRNVIDLPFPPGTYLTPEDMDVLVRYNHHDVDETEAFYLYTLEQIHFREQLSLRYGKNMMNYNDPKIGKEYFIMKLEQAHPGACYDPGTRKPRQTYRECIDFRNVVLPWIQFKRPEFQAVCDWFKRQVITDTKGVFTDINEDSLGDELVQYCSLKQQKQRLLPGVPLPAKHTVQRMKNGNLYAVWNKVENLHVVVNGFQFDFGTGGIHGSVSSRTVRSDAEYVIIDLDVASYYPNLAIANNLYPEHLGAGFCDIYLDVYNQRKQYKKGTPENGAFKLALNAVYGQSNNGYSPFYDPQYTMSITVNGQLLLCLLADYLMDIPGLEMIQVNTDGLTVKIPRANVWILEEIAKWWQEHTRLQLESVEYEAMWIRDVNSYIAKTTSGKVKRKGAYAHVFKPPAINKGNGDLDWHQDHSALVVPKAAEAALVEGKDITQFILGHADPFDFMLRAKVPRSSRLFIDDVQVQNITRYYVATNGGTMMKVMPPHPNKPEKERATGICVGRRVRECNDASHFDRSLIDYGYYIAEAEKLVKPLL